jgi:hypothetical protein
VLIVQYEEILLKLVKHPSLLHIDI